MVKRLVIQTLMLFLATVSIGCYEVKENQCEPGAVRCEDGEALTCTESDLWFYWNRERCFSGSVCIFDTSGESPAALCALDDQKDERCIGQPENEWICSSETDVIRCKNGYAVAQQRCPPTSVCSATEDPQTVCTAPTDPVPYCEIGIPGLVCASEDSTAYCDLNGFVRSETPCANSTQCVDGRCR